MKPKCDGNHGGPRCGDPECWNDDPVIEPHGVKAYRLAKELCDHLAVVPVIEPAEALTTRQPEPAGEAVACWIKAVNRVPLESDGEVFVRFTDGSIGTGWATYWHGASKDFAQWTFPDPDENRTVLEWAKNVPNHPPAAAPAPAVPQGWKSVLVPTEWTMGPNLFKDWCAQWFGPDSDDGYLMRAAHALLGLAVTPAPAPAQDVGLTDELRNGLALLLSMAYESGFVSNEAFPGLKELLLSEADRMSDEVSVGDCLSTIIAALRAKGAA